MLPACSDENGQGESFEEGSGTAADPYQISTIAHLNAIRGRLLSKHYILMNDLDFNGYTYDDNDKGWLPIGSVVYDYDRDRLRGNPFSGSFDGNDKVIRNLRISRGDGKTREDIGLFGTVAGGINSVHDVLEPGGEVKNLGLEAVEVTGGYVVGGLVGRSLGTVSNCYVTGAVEAIVVQIDDGDASHSTATGGGLMGGNGGTISNCYATSTVEMTGRNNSLFGRIGGLVGGSDYVGMITNCYATGAVSGDGNEGFIGGLVGDNESMIRSCYATGEVSGGDSDIDNHIGGLLGRSRLGTITNSYATGAVSGTSSNVGGLVGGTLDGSPITNSYATGAVSVSGTSAVGGLVGRGSGSGDGMITNSYATGAVSASGTDSDVGGLVGVVHFGFTITESYATGAVSASGTDSDVGGLVGGGGTRDRFTITNSYATGAVSASGMGGHVGGLMGLNSSGGTVTNSYWNTDTSGQSEGIGENEGTATGVAGLTSAEMRMQGSYVSWDFTMIWHAPTASSYPTLREVGGQ